MKTVENFRVAVISTWYVFCKQRSVNKPSRAGKFRFLYAGQNLLCTLSALIVVPLAMVTLTVSRADAASWQWSSQPGRERIEVRFDKPARDVSASRTGTTQLTIQLDGPASGFTGSGAGQLVRGVSAEGETLRLALRDPAFGYVVSRPNPTTIRVDVFADALGARWKGAGSASPATPPVAATPAATTPVSPPAPTGQTPATQNGTPRTSPTAAAGLTTPPTAANSPLSQTPAAQTTARQTPTVQTSVAQPPVGQTTPPTAGLPKSPAASTSDVPPGEFVPLGPAPAPPNDGNTPRTRETAPQNGNTTPRVDPRTVGRAPLSDGRNVMAAPANAPRTQTTPLADTTPDAADAVVPPIDIPKDPEVPMPTTNDLSRITGHLEALGVGEPRPDNALGAVRGSIDPSQPVTGTEVPAPGAANPAVAPAASNGTAGAPTEPVSAPVFTPPATSAVPPLAAESATRPVSATAERQPLNFSQAMPDAVPVTPTQVAPAVSQVPPVSPNGQARPPRSAAENWAMTADQASSVLAAMPPLGIRAQQAAPNASSAPTSTASQAVRIPVPATTQASTQAPVAVAEVNPANAFRGRMLRPGETPDPAVLATPVVPPAPVPSATPAPAASAPVATVADAAPASNPAPDRQPDNSQRQPMRQSMTNGGDSRTPGQVSPTVPDAPDVPAAPDVPDAPDVPGASPSTALQQGKEPSVVPENSVVQHTPTTASPAVVGGQTATEAALAPPPAATDAPDQETRQVLGGSGVLGKNTNPNADDTTVIYVDEKGNVVPKPPDIPAMMKDVQQQMNNLQFQTALDLLLPMKDMVLPPETREQVLYSISECLGNIYKDKPLEGYEPITKATSEAMNFNLSSERVPEALYRLGVLNLRVGNQQDGAGYFGAMRTRYPHVESVPYGYFALGQDQLKNKQYAEAVRSFQTVMDEYPESKAVRDAARGMAEALYRQGHYDRAQILVDFVDRRWPRIYLEDPTYLPMVGEIQTRMQDYDNALQTYWTSYNLTPDAPDNHKLLLQIGAIYLQSGYIPGARYVFAELLRKYPTSESAPKAVLLMAEQGFSKDNPTLDEMFTVFGRPGDMPVEAAYRKLMNEYPDSPEALQAELRDTALSYWNGDTDEAMAKAQAFISRHPDIPESERAKEIIRRGFTRALEMAKQEENNERILSLWEKYPEVQAAYPNPDDDLRVAMARAKLNRGDEAAGLADLAPFLDKPQGKYSDYVYNLFLAKHLQDSNWNGILDLGEKVKDWKMPTDIRNQLDYSRAISAENLGMKARSLPIWERLHKLPDGELPLYQKAYATYFMAREAENRRDLKDAYDLNLRTLDLFTRLEEERSDKADPERVRESLAGLMDVTEVAGRFAEALEWTERYGVFVSQDSPDYAGLLFRQARLHRKMGDMARWRSQLDMIVQREPDSVFGRMAASELRTQEVSRNLTRFTEQPKPTGSSSSSDPAPGTP